MRMSARVLLRLRPRRREIRFAVGDMFVAQERLSDETSSQRDLVQNLRLRLRLHVGRARPSRRRDDLLSTEKSSSFVSTNAVASEKMSAATTTTTAAAAAVVVEVLARDDVDVVVDGKWKFMPGWNATMTIGDRVVRVVNEDGIVFVRSLAWAVARVCALMGVENPEWRVVVVDDQDCGTLKGTIESFFPEALSKSGEDVRVELKTDVDGNPRKIRVDDPDFEDWGAVVAFEKEGDRTLSTMIENCFRGTEIKAARTTAEDGSSTTFLNYYE